MRWRFAWSLACWSARARKRNTASSSDSSSDVWNASGLSFGTRRTFNKINRAWWQSSPSFSSPQEHEWRCPIFTRCFSRAGRSLASSPSGAFCSATTKDVGPVVDTRSMRRRSTPSAPSTSLILCWVAADAVLMNGVGRAPMLLLAGWRASGIFLCVVRPMASTVTAVCSLPAPESLRLLEPYDRCAVPAESLRD